MKCAYFRYERREKNENEKSRDDKLNELNLCMQLERETLFLFMFLYLFFHPTLACSMCVLLTHRENYVDCRIDVCAEVNRRHE